MYLEEGSDIPRRIRRWRTAAKKAMPDALLHGSSMTAVTYLMIASMYVVQPNIPTTQFPSLLSWKSWAMVIGSGLITAVVLWLVGFTIKRQMRYRR